MNQPPPFCRHLGSCGGCHAPHDPYPVQIAAKERTLRSILAGAGGGRRDAPLAPVFVPGLAADAHGAAAEPKYFRQKVAFVFGDTPRGLVMGHFARGTQTVVPVVECPVHSQRGNAIAFELRDALARAGVRAAGAGRSGILRHLLVRTTADDREAVAMLVVTRNARALRAPIRTLLDSRHRPDGFFLNLNDSPGPYMVGRETIRIAGLRHVHERIGELSFLVSPTAFFQTNVAAATRLQGLVVAAVGASQEILDLYCGSGLFSLPLAAAGRRVVGVEENRRAVTDAEANRLANRIPAGRLRFVAERVERSLGSVRGGRWDAVVLDPPRTGCLPAVRQAVFRRLRPRSVVYVSCNPEALAAELPEILEAGYRIGNVQAVDMFPHTEHIEAVVTLHRAA